MRKGQNPGKFVDSVAQPERITVAVLNYIPFLSGFYAQSLDVLRLCLNSARQDAGLPFDLLVFDNGSCKEVKEWLLAEQGVGNIDYLLLSDKNLGKGGAWNQILSGAPGEIIAYADSDVLFKPGWLSRSVEVLTTYPRAGMVTARPYRTSPGYYTATLEWAKNTADVKLEEGTFIPWADFLEFDLSLGQEVADIRDRYDATTDWKLRYQGVEALAGASHWQFTAYKQTLQQFLPFRMHRPMGQVRQLDQRVNEAGLLRLMLPEPFAMNMSNNVPPAEAAGPTPVKARSKLIDLPVIRKPLLKLYDAIFRWYYDR